MYRVTFNPGMWNEQSFNVQSYGDIERLRNKPEFEHAEHEVEYTSTL